MTEHTSDGRYILVAVRRWRATDPMIPPERSAELRSALMAWRREVKAVRGTEAERRARDDWGATAMVMTVLAQRPDLIAWYERRGYRPTGESRPFPYGNVRYGLPKVPDLRFVTLAKPLADALTPAPDGR